MLFGDYPFFGLTIPSLVKDIKAKVGKLKFPREVSQESKDLIQSLLQPKPSKRIDWHSFFNHQLFKKFDKGEGQNEDFNDVINNVANLLLKSKKFDDEFQQNKQKVNMNKEIDYMDEDDIKQYGHKKKINP